MRWWGVWGSFCWYHCYWLWRRDVFITFGGRTSLADFPRWCGLTKMVTHTVSMTARGGWLAGMSTLSNTLTAPIKIWFFGCIVAVTSGSITSSEMGKSFICTESKSGLFCVSQRLCLRFPVLRNASYSKTLNYHFPDFTLSAFSYFQAHPTSCW